MKDFLGWYIVKAPVTVRVYKCKTWCEKNIASGTWQFESWADVFSFRDESDAVAFKLVFGT